MPNYCDDNQEFGQTKRRSLVQVDRIVSTDEFPSLSAIHTYLVGFEASTRQRNLSEKITLFA